MSKRVCAEPGCPVIGDNARCNDHTRDKDRARGSRQQRGYDREHELARESWRPAVERGGIPCRRCRKPLDPTQPWDLGHPDADCDRPRAPECVRCNRGVNGR